MYHRTIKDYLMIVVGDFFLAYAIIAFWLPQNLVTGGVSGIAIIVAHYSKNAGVLIPIWFTNLALNIPLFIIGYKTLKKGTIFKTLFASLFLNVALFLAEFMPIPSTDLLTGAIFGGVVGGIGGVGLVLRASGSTGGTILAAAILKRMFFRQFSVAKIFFVIDASIVLAGLLVFGPVATMYAVMALFVVTKITDTVIEGFVFAKAAFIISKQSDAIAEDILSDLDRGVTQLPSRGMFTREDQPMLMCVVTSKEIVQLKELVYSKDKKAFMIVTDVHEVLGEGFKKANENL
jgi:uncharacterized membrane-anchored protein YitT (DUF2179 family)